MCIVDNCGALSPKMPKRISNGGTHHTTTSPTVLTSTAESCTCVACTVACTVGEWQSIHLVYCEYWIEPVRERSWSDPSRYEDTKIVDAFCR